MTDIQESIIAARKRLEGIKKSIEGIQASKQDRSLPQTCQGDVLNKSSICHMRARRILRGHFGKVYSTHWSGDSVHLVSASQDGKLMVWNGLTTNKVQSIPLASSWVIACAFEQKVNRFVACGGMDNVCSLYKLDRVGSNRVVRVSQELSGHHGYLSCCRFMDESRLLTASGDSTCRVWDVERGRADRVFSDHGADAMSVALCPTNPNIFASGSCDATSKVWDVRTNKSVVTFRGHASDVNSVHFFPDGQAVGTGSDDHTCKLFDMRCVNALNTFGNDKIISGITSVAFSRSGRFLFAGYEDFMVRCWDVVSAESTCHQSLSGHENRVSTISVNPAGDALLSGSWDTTLRVWA